MVAGIKELATSQGFRGEYFADEILWTTVDEENWDNGPPVSQLIAAKYYTRTITEHRGLGVNVTINTFFQEPFLAPIRNLCNTLAGAEPIDTTLSVAGEADQYEALCILLCPMATSWLHCGQMDEAVE